MEKQCQECGEKLIGRIDKKFCNDQCRNAYNNRLKVDENNYVRKVNNILRKNRRILAKMNPNQKSKTHRDKLLSKGFNFSYYTNTYTTKDDRVYFYCYDQGFLELENGWYALVKKKDYIN